MKQIAPLIAAGILLSNVCALPHFPVSAAALPKAAQQKIITQQNNYSITPFSVKAETTEDTKPGTTALYTETTAIFSTTSAKPTTTVTTVSKKAETTTTASTSSKKAETTTTAAVTETTAIMSTTEAAKPESDFVFSITEDGKGMTLKEYKGSAAEVVIPEKFDGLPVVEIGSMAFFNHENLTKVTIPDSVTVIGSNAFSSCPGLTAITIPKNVTELGDSAFASCSGLTKITIPESVKAIGSQAFSGCSGLADIVIPETVTQIGGGAFRDTAWLKAQQAKDPLVVVNNILIDASTASGKVVLPGGITEISGMAFSNNRAVTAVNMDRGVKAIGESAFYNCSGLTQISLPYGLESIGSQAFGMCSGLTTIAIPDTVKEIGGSAFMACEKLTTVQLPKALTAIGNSAFMSCAALTRVKIPENVKTIDVRAFAGCAALKETVIPDSVESIGFAAFMMCSNLESITIPEQVTSIGPTAFSGCPKLTVHGYAGSAAETYAQQNNLNFAAIGPVRGDVNGDKQVSIEDAQIALTDYTETVAGNKSTLSEQQIQAADINEDSKIDVVDAQLILTYYVQNTVVGQPVSWGELLGKWSAKYIRISWREAEYPTVKKIASREELDAYIEANKDLYSVESNYKELYKEADETYTAEWFKDHQLVVVLVGEGSGSIRHQVSDVSADEIQITRLSEQAMTADMAAWAIAIELDKSVTISDNVSVTLSRLEWEN